MTNQLKSPGQASSSGANNYTDFNGLAALKKDPSSPQAIHAVARQIDALFLQMMLKSMRDASAAMGEADSNEMGMYQDMFDKQISLSLSQNQSLGLGAQLTRQLGGAAGAAGTGTATTGAAAPVPTASTGGTAANDERAATDDTSRVTASSADAAAAAMAADGITPAQFVRQIYPAIQRAAQTLGVDPVAMLAQAALETGWGKRMARAADGTPSNNMFGIKADDAWAGPRATAMTVEFSGGVATQHRATFRAYDSIEDSVNDYAKLIGRSPRYRNALAGGGNAAAYVAAIAKSGYATDPRYVDKLNDIMQSGTFRGALMAHKILL